MNSKSHWIAIIVLVLGFAAVDFLLPMFPRLMQEFSSNYPNPLFISIFSVGVGVVVGQVALLVTWAALGRGSMLTRLLGSLTLLVIGWYAILLGHRVVLWFDNGYLVLNYRNGFFDVYLETATIVGSLLILGFFFFQGLLCLLRGVRGWRIDLTSSTGDEPTETQFSIRQLMIWTAVVAVLLTLGKLVVPPIPSGRSYSALGSEAIPILISTTVPLILALICSRLALAKRIHVIWVTVIVAVSGLSIFLVQLATLYGLMRYFGPVTVDGEEVILMIAALAGVNAGHIAGQFGPLLLFRLWGYRLTTRKQRSKEQANRPVTEDIVAEDPVAENTEAIEPLSP